MIGLWPFTSAWGRTTQLLVMFNQWVFHQQFFHLTPPHPTLPPQHPFNLWECLLLTRIVYVVYTLWMFLTMYIFNLSVTHSELWHLLIFPIREAINRLCEAVPGGKGAWRKKVNLSMMISMNDFLHTCQIKNYLKDNPFRGVPKHKQTEVEIMTIQ